MELRRLTLGSERSAASFQQRLYLPPDHESTTPNATAAATAEAAGHSHASRNPPLTQCSHSSQMACRCSLSLLPHELARSVGVPYQEASTIHCKPRANPAACSSATSRCSRVKLGANASSCPRASGSSWSTQIRRLVGQQTALTNVATWVSPVTQRRSCAALGVKQQPIREAERVKINGGAAEKSSKHGPDDFYPGARRRFFAQR